MTFTVPPADEPIRALARERLGVPVPPSLTDDVMRAVERAADTRTHRFSPMLIGVSSVAAVAVLLAAALIVSGPRNVGPVPVPSGSLQPSPTATPAPTLTAESELSLTQPGDIVRIAAMDGNGRYGTITLERGDDVAGYPPPHTELFTESFFIEVRVSYELDRATELPYGRDDWSFRADGAGGFIGQYLNVDFTGASLPPLLPNRQRGDVPMQGWLVLAVPSEAAEFPINLAYMDRTVQPQTEARTFAEIRLREPGQPVGVSPAWTAPPGMTPPPLDAPSPHPEAEALFEDVRRCESGDGWAVDLPGTWFTNAAADGLPACSWFGSVPFDVGDPTTPPDGVAIVIERRIGDAIEPIGLEHIFGMGATLAGVDAFWAERLGTGGGVIPEGERMLHYELLLNARIPVLDPEAEWIYAGTSTLDAATEAEYELHKAVLHRIMASIELTDP